MNESLIATIPTDMGTRRTVISAMRYAAQYLHNGELKRMRTLNDGPYYALLANTDLSGGTILLYIPRTGEIMSGSSQWEKYCTDRHTLLYALASIGKRFKQSEHSRIMAGYIPALLRIKYFLNREAAGMGFENIQTWTERYVHSA